MLTAGNALLSGTRGEIERYEPPDIGELRCDVGARLRGRGLGHADGDSKIPTSTDGLFCDIEARAGGGGVIIGAPDARADAALLHELRLHRGCQVEYGARQEGNRRVRIEDQAKLG